MIFNFIFAAMSCYCINPEPIPNISNPAMPDPKYTI